MTNNNSVQKNVPVYIKRDDRKIQIGWASTEVEGQRTLDIFDEFKNQLANPDNFIYEEDNQGLLDSIATESSEPLVQNNLKMTPTTKEN